MRSWGKKKESEKERKNGKEEERGKNKIKCNFVNLVEGDINKSIKFLNSKTWDHNHFGL